MLFSQFDRYHFLTLLNFGHFILPTVHYSAPCISLVQSMPKVISPSLLLTPTFFKLH